MNGISSNVLSDFYFTNNVFTTFNVDNPDNENQLSNSTNSKNLVGRDVEKPFQITE